MGYCVYLSQCCLLFESQNSRLSLLASGTGQVVALQYAIPTMTPIQILNTELHHTHHPPVFYLVLEWPHCF